MEVLLKLVAVAGLAIVWLWAAVPLGMAFNLHPLLNLLASVFGATLGVVAVIFLSHRVRNWLLKKKSGRAIKKGRVFRIWEKYGVIGLGLLAPPITGTTLGAAFGITMGASPRRLLFWMSIGIILWAIIFMALSALGFTGFRHINDSIEVGALFDIICSI